MSGFSTSPRLHSLQIGLPRTLGSETATDPMDKVWTTGFFKKTVSGPVWLGTTNLVGDGQADLQNHGGVDKAVNVYPLEHYSYWASDLMRDDLPPGAFGENFTTQGLLEAEVCIGDTFELGEAIVQVSQPRQPCWKLARRWRIKDLALRVQQTGRTGWYFRVLKEGRVQTGDLFRQLDRLQSEWTIAAANDVMHHHKHDLAAAASLAACPALSVSWHKSLTKRVASGTAANTARRLDGN